MRKNAHRVREDSKIQNCPPDSTTLLLRYKKPFNFNQVLSFLKSRAMAGLEVITENSYARTFRTDSAKGFFVIKDNPKQSALDLWIACDDIKCYMEIHNRVRRMFDLDTDFTVINAQFAKDKRLAKGMVNGHVPRLPIAFDPFEFVVRAILGQQISVKAATTLAARVARQGAIKTDDSFPRGLDYFFPTPSELVPLELGGLGVTKTRQATIKTAVKGVLDRDVHLTANQSFNRFYTDFSKLKGIGEWTVNYVAMRGLGMLDSFPAGDLGVIKALATGDKLPSKKEVLKMAEKWRPYRAYATLCLWNRSVSA
ncbi:MAG: DNA-3-methyladenine glycosylase 2 family protein [Desulfobacterium sp.]|nr:DNA-3-methyladenine glycosylase 2 family protein [Desulfobacterium sp.]